MMDFVAGVADLVAWIRGEMFRGQNWVDDCFAPS
jgi:hypothetical protein